MWDGLNETIINFIIHYKMLSWNFSRYFESRLLEIDAFYTIQVSFEKQNETSKPFRPYLNVKK